MNQQRVSYYVYFFMLVAFFSTSLRIANDRFLSFPASPLQWPISPLCTTDDEIFRSNEQKFLLFMTSAGSNDVIHRPPNNRKCRLRQFTARDVTSCIDDMHEKSNLTWLHFSFIGDSRMRQQYLNMVKVVKLQRYFEKINVEEVNFWDHCTNFFQLIPNIDITTSGPDINEDPLASIHQDLTMTSHFLQLIISFRWRPLLDDFFVNEISEWLLNPTPLPPKLGNKYPPYFVLIGILSD